MTTEAQLTLLTQRLGEEFNTLRTEIQSIGVGLPAGSLAVRYDATQPEVNCFWCAPDGSVILITGY